MPTFFIVIMSGIGNNKRDKYTFKKLQNFYNYKQQMQDMSFTLKKAKFQKYVKKTVVEPLFFEAKKDDSKD